MITPPRVLTQVFVSALVVLSLACFVHASASAQEPGTTADPLVSKSYLDQFFRFHSLIVPSGQKLPLQQGALLVVRSGKCRFSAAKGKSLLDLTEGKEVSAGSILPLHHLLLVPDTGELQLEALAISHLMAQGLRPRK